MNMIQYDSYHAISLCWKCIYDPNHILLIKNNKEELLCRSTGGQILRQKYLADIHNCKYTT